jgi:hypothetical protein
MKIYCDTREQRPLEFEVDGEVSEVITTKLPYGDYACGWEDKEGKHVKFMPLFFERKSLGDLYGTMGKGMERFKKEIERANDDGSKLIIIVEACFAEVKNGYEHSKMEGESILKTLHTLWVKHDVPYILCNDRKDMKETILHFFSSIGRNFKPKGKHHESQDREKEADKRSLATRTGLVGESAHFGLRDDEEA